MLLYFGVKGYLSFKNFQEMYLIPPPGARLKGTKYEHNFHLDVKNRPMKSVVLFGDNASGKTNWIYALSRCTSIVRNGLRTIDPDKFHYDSSSVYFKISVCNDYGAEYEYELEFDRSGVVLVESLKRNDLFVFSFANERLKINQSDISDKQKSLQDLFSQRSTDILLLKLRDWLVEPISEFIDLVSRIRVKTEDPINFSVKFFPMLILDAGESGIFNEYPEEVLAILQSIDPTIYNFSFDKILIEGGETKIRPFVTRIVEGKPKKFEIDNESLGIKKMIYLLPYLLQIHNGNTVAIDELDSSIGAKSLIRIFNTIINSPLNTNGQLIVSSHNLELLNLDLFHETQLQIFRKGTDLGSVVNGVDEYDYRAEKKNLDQIYLRGGFGS